MSAPDFDFQSFAQDLAAQAQGLVPEEFNDEQKQYVVNTLGNFSMMAGQALAQDPNLTFDADTSKTITQIIAEWSFHKSVDVIRSGIPRQYWDSVMQKIAYTIFEIAKQAFGQNLPSDQCLELVEHHVKNAYAQALQELNQRGIIDEGLMEFAQSQSNMDKMAQEMQQQAQQNSQPSENSDTQISSDTDLNVQYSANDFPKVDSKVLKLATVAMLFKRMNQDKVQTILNTFNDEDAQAVIKYMQIPDLTKKIGPYNALRCLKEIKTNLPKNTDFTPSKIVNIIRKFTQNKNHKQLETMLSGERLEVKRLVFSAVEGEYYNKIPQKVASIIALHLKDSV